MPTLTAALGRLCFKTGIVVTHLPHWAVGCPVFARHTGLATGHYAALGRLRTA
jgi:hypothetical protein